MQAMGIQYLPTGCDSLDAILEGGLREGTLTELVGASATGKTQVSLLYETYQIVILQGYVFHNISARRLF
jgi:KaiC/GvpD/RAD55 family RecA-like ATPase